MKMRVAVALLLVLNLGLLAALLGAFDGVLPDGREPQRMKNQLNPERVRVLGAAGVTPTPPDAPASAPASVPGSVPGSVPAAVPSASAPAPAAAASTPASPAPATAPAAVPTQTTAANNCLELANLTLADARRLEARLTALAPRIKPERRELKEELTHMVWIPPSGGKAGADQRAAELREQGVQEFFILQEAGSQRYGISLGVFKSEEAAKAQLERLNRQGVKSARVVEHKLPYTRIAFLLRGLDGATRDKLEALKPDFPKMSVRRSCG